MRTRTTHRQISCYGAGFTRRYSVQVEHAGNAAADYRTTRVVRGRGDSGTRRGCRLTRAVAAAGGSQIRSLLGRRAAAWWSGGTSRLPATALEMECYSAAHLARCVAPSTCSRPGLAVSGSTPTGGWVHATAWQLP